MCSAVLQHQEQHKQQVQQAEATHVCMHCRLMTCHGKGTPDRGGVVQFATCGRAWNAGAIRCACHQAGLGWASSWGVGICNTTTAAAVYCRLKRRRQQQGCGSARCCVQPSRGDVANLPPTCWSAAVAPASVAGVASELRLRRFNLRDPSAAAAVCRQGQRREVERQQASGEPKH